MRSFSFAAWVSGVGNPRLRYQGEVLLPRGATVEIVALAGYSDRGVPIVDVEVYW